MEPTDDNSYHVVKVDANTTATFDGLTIANGNANAGTGSGTDNYLGGGLYAYGTVTLHDVTFDSNSARYGGGMENAGPSVSTLTNVTFVDNYAYTDGGAMDNAQGSQPTVTNATFAYNEAVGNGGAISNSTNSLVLRNVTLSGNTAAHGGAIVNTNSNPQIYDTIFWGNGPALPFWYVGTAAPTIVDSIVYNGCPTGAPVCINVINLDPLLAEDVSGNPILADNGGNTETIAIGATSPAKDAGNASVGFTNACASTDQRGVTRPQGTACDIGAYEIIQHTIAGNAGVPGANLHYVGTGGSSGISGNVTANGSGDYSFYVPDGWSGTVTPSKSGYTFVPVSRTYSNVTTDLLSENYTAYVAISGAITWLTGRTGFQPVCHRNSFLGRRRRTVQASLLLRWQLHV